MREKSWKTPKKRKRSQPRKDKSFYKKKIRGFLLRLYVGRWWQIEKNLKGEKKSEDLMNTVNRSEEKEKIARKIEKWEMRRRTKMMKIKKRWEIFWDSKYIFLQTTKKKNKTIQAIESLHEMYFSTFLSLFLSSKKFTLNYHVPTSKTSKKYSFSLSLSLFSFFLFLSISPYSFFLISNIKKCLRHLLQILLFTSFSHISISFRVKFFDPSTRVWEREREHTFQKHRLHPPLPYFESEFINSKYESF